jgi:hypothetical protein
VETEQRTPATGEKVLKYKGAEEAEEDSDEAEEAREWKEEDAAAAEEDQGRSAEIGSTEGLGLMLHTINGLDRERRLWTKDMEEGKQEEEDAEENENEFCVLRKVWGRENGEESTKGEVEEEEQSEASQEKKLTMRAFRADKGRTDHVTDCEETAEGDAVSSNEGEERRGRRAAMDCSPAATGFSFR